MDTSKDDELVKRFQSGDKAALALLVKRYHKDFCNKSYWLVKDADLAKDIAQECWSTIMNKINSLKEANSFGSWAMRIVYSKSLDVLRKESKDRLNKQAYLKDKVEEDEDKVDHTELERLLLVKIKQLPEHQQTVIQLFYVENYSLKEISKLVNISVGTAKSRLFHARETLKKTLKYRNYEK